MTPENDLLVANLPFQVNHRRSHNWPGNSSVYDAKGKDGFFFRLTVWTDRVETWDGVNPAKLGDVLGKLEVWHNPGGFLSAIQTKKVYCAEVRVAILCFSDSDPEGETWNWVFRVLERAANNFHRRKMEAKFGAKVPETDEKPVPKGEKQG